MVGAEGAAALSGVCGVVYDSDLFGADSRERALKLFILMSTCVKVDFINNNNNNNNVYYIQY